MVAAPALAYLMIAGCAPLQFDRLVDFQPTTVATPIDFDRVSEYARYAQASYRPDAEIMEMFPDTVRISTPGGNGVRYFLEVSPQEQTQTIAVAGTRTFSDILHDIAFAIVPDNLLHAAFHEGFEAEARLVYADVRPHLNPDYQVRLTGHSLGAAVSAILMIYLQGDGYLIEPSINFGQPKFMNRASAELYSDLPLQRVVDANDIVPMLPPRFLLHPTHGAYAHVGEEIILLEGAYFVHLTSHDAERLSVDQFWRDRDFASREDHHMARYTERIAAKQVLAQEVDYMVWRSMAAN